MSRPREFDTQLALEHAMQMFWQKGYSGTTVQDLVDATGLKKQSLYGAFGHKQDIYLATLRLYERTRMHRAVELLLKDGSARDRVGSLLDSVIDARFEDGGERGCMLCNAAAEHAPDDTEARSAISECTARFEGVFGAAISETRPYDTDLTLRLKRGRALLAAYFGLNILAKAGAPRQVLEDVKISALETI